LYQEVSRGGILGGVLGLTRGFHSLSQPDDHYHYAPNLD
jgi:hypothetical protein